MTRALVLATFVAALAAAPAQAVNVRVPAPGEVSVGVVTTAKPPAGSKRASRVLRVTNARRLPSGTAVYATAAPACSAATRNRFTAIVVVTRHATSGRGARSAAVGGRRGAVARCGSYPLLAKLGSRGIPRLRCDRLASRRSGALLLGSDATCIGAVQREIRMPSPYQLPLNVDLGTPVATGPPASRNFTGTAQLVGEPRPGVFRYAITFNHRTPPAYRGVASDPLDRQPDTLTFAAVGGEEAPNVVGGPLEVESYQCRTEIAPGLPGSLTCRAPRGTPLDDQLTLEVDFDRQLPAGPNLGVDITLPRYGDSATRYDLDVT